MYTEVQKKKANEIIDELINKINNFVIVDNDVKRRLNQIEIFFCIYDFVANRFYRLGEMAEDIVGVLNSNQCVCTGFSKLIKLLCDRLGINCIIKEVQGYDENGKIISQPHYNNEVFISDKTGLYHCLHVDATCDCLDNVYGSIRYNFALITDSEVRLYHHSQQIIDGTNFIFKLLSENRNAQFLKKYLFELDDMTIFNAKFLGKTKNQISLERIKKVESDLIEMLQFFNEDYNTVDINNEEIIRLYQKLCDKYTMVSTPINPQEYLQAFMDVQKLLGYDFLEAKKKIDNSISFQRLNFNNDNGQSAFFVASAENKFSNFVA